MHFRYATSKQYLLGSEMPQMVDFFAFPHISRVFYLKNSLLGKQYDSMNLENRCPHVYKWFKTIRDD